MIEFLGITRERVYSPGRVEDDAAVLRAVAGHLGNLGHRVDVFNAGHGVAVKSNVVVQDSYIHGLGGNTQAHKDGVFIGDGSNSRIIHNTVECNDGPERGCTAAIGESGGQTITASVDAAVMSARPKPPPTR